MLPGRRNPVGHVGPADAKVEALAVRNILIQPQEESIRRARHRNRIQPVVAITIGARRVIRQWPQGHVVGEQGALQRETVFASRRSPAGDVGRETYLPPDKAVGAYRRSRDPSILWSHSPRNMIR